MLELRSLRLPAILGVLTLLPACEFGLPAGPEPHREGNALDMGDQPKLKPQRGDLVGETPTGMLAPPVGSIAVGEEPPYPFTQEQGDLAGETLKNPLSASPKVLAHGEFIFENVCIACHGPEGAGDGHVTKLFPAPPSLMTQKVRDWSDGRIFHVPMRGQASMPSHASVVSTRDIWSVIHHIRALQAKLPVAPPPEDAAPDSAPDTEGGDDR
jgi:mono/diheme cytochrome c family protein